ncbi:hypothetical protein [Pseudolactococcus carnosus]|uniref:Uncharacterized protein n=1 Tax=Pseudolactococcus carnosus TaxID=2749961 RepID=A0ABT0AW82_9LACT|nr:hypothetical protein [Lactococcus carnosus]MCJ1990829.1 hypothetical protein [Lactococcus carnosus]
MEIKAHENEKEIFKFSIDNLNSFELSYIRLALSLTNFDLETYKKINGIVTNENLTEEFLVNFGKSFFKKLNSFSHDIGYSIPDNFYKEAIYKCDTALRYAEYEATNQSSK